MFWDTFLSVLGVIGIIAVAAFVIVFLSDLFISIIDGTNGIFFKRNKNKANNSGSEDEIKRPKLLDKNVKQLEEPEEEPTQEEEVEQQKAPVVLSEEKEEEVEEPHAIDLEQARLEEEEAKKNMGIAQEPQNEVVRETPSVESKKDEDSDGGREIESFINQVTEETREEYVELARKKDEEERQKAIEAEKEELEESKKREEELARKIEELTRQIEEDKEKIKALEEKNVGTIQMVKMPTESKEELENRLEVLKQRLKENEKELSVNRKEFVPLRRVNMTLDNDKKKLSRKEAIVAKQKVVLYGVNNYVDIDEEKAKKLSEELDLLEGLRLSVQHCEEVMQKNKDRYPILERANAFLVKNQAQLKEDIADIERKLALIEEENKAKEEGNPEVVTVDDTTNGNVEG